MYKFIQYYASLSLFSLLLFFVPFVVRGVLLLDISGRSKPSSGNGILPALNLCYQMPSLDEGSDWPEMSRSRTTWTTKGTKNNNKLNNNKLA